MIRDYMIDIETLSTEPNAVVTSIGAVEFNINDGTVINDFYRELELDYQMTKGRHISADTVLWALQTQAGCFNGDTTTVGQALLDLNNFIMKGDKRVWCKGANFDSVILNSLYKDLGPTQTPPWGFRDVCCMRPFINLDRSVQDEYYQNNTNDNHHNALADCKDQVKLLHNLFMNWGISL